MTRLEPGCSPAFLASVLEKHFLCGFLGYRKLGLKHTLLCNKIYACVQVLHEIMVKFDKNGDGTIDYRCVN